MTAAPVSTGLQRLYAAPFDEFMATRKQIVAELRAAGDAAAAREMASAPKPTRTAWALDQVARQQPDLLTALLRARDQAMAPPSGDPEGLRRTMREYRERAADVVRAAREVLARDGAELSAIQARRLLETLQAACADEGGSREALLAGILARDIEVGDPLASLSDAVPGDAGGATRAVAKQTTGRELQREQEQERKERETRAAALAAARAKVARFEEEARAAVARMRAAQVEAESARRAMQEADARLAEARKELARLDRGSVP